MVAQRARRDGWRMSQRDAFGWNAAEAERAFDRALRARRRASLLLRLRRRCVACARLAIHDVGSLTLASARGAVREIQLDAIMGSVEPNRATLFDREFRPSASARGRWLSVWHLEQRGARLPPHLGRRSRGWVCGP
jgi:hypothetical protein